ncbi:unnamed protein product, partial [marine sediment metagenome]
WRHLSQDIIDKIQGTVSEKYEELKEKVIVSTGVAQ